MEAFLKKTSGSIIASEFPCKLILKLNWNIYLQEAYQGKTEI